MRRGWGAAVGVFVVAVGVFTVAAFVLRDERSAAPVPGPPQSRTAAARVADARAAIQENPRAHQAYAALATAALQQARETSDPSWYSVADEAANRARTIAPDNVEAIDALAALANARHRFRAALAFSRRSLAVEPDHFAPLETGADALIELGRYKEGFAMVQERLRLRPDAASYSRASYVAELTGDHTHAIELMGLAVAAAGPGSEARAWTRVQLALLRVESGDIARAERELRAALAETPDDSGALAGLARIAAHRGELDTAASLYERALAATPSSVYAAALIEVDTARGRDDRVAAGRALLDKLNRAEQQQGVRLAMDRALIDADLRRPTPADVARARAAHRTRPGVFGDQILGWVLTRAGSCDEGLRYARRSLRLGTKNSLMLFHAGSAAHCAGEHAEARRYLSDALARNPSFSVRWAPEARRMLDEVGA